MIVMHVRVVPVPALFSMSTRVVLEKYEDDDDTIEGVPCLRLRCQNDETILVFLLISYCSLHPKLRQSFIIASLFTYWHHSY